MKDNKHTYQSFVFLEVLRLKKSLLVDDHQDLADDIMN